MWLSESLVSALEGYDISGVKVYCETSIREEVKNYFLADYATRWNDAKKAVEQEYGDCYSDELPATVYDKDYGFFISVGELELRYCGGDFYDLTYGPKAFDKALKSMKEKYPDIEYEGYIGYILSDRRSGEASQSEVSSKDNIEVYDFVGEILGDILATEVYVPEEPFDAEDLNFVVTGKLKFFENREEITEYIEDLGANVTGSISKKTNYLINNDLDSTSSKNTKAKELGIPVISEADFIAMFGDASEYDIESSEFWESLVGELECNEDFDETIKVLYAYSNWIKKSDIDRAVRILIELAGAYDEDMKEELSELVKKLEAGEIIENEEDDDSNLPDGYMEALEMFMMAEDISGTTPRRGEVISSEGTFDILIAKAEEGDAEAKLTAGKYFIADHIEEETERAIQWIREAAEAGIKDAEKYIEAHKELFD